MANPGWTPHSLTPMNEKKTPYIEEEMVPRPRTKEAENKPLLAWTTASQINVELSCLTPRLVGSYKNCRSDR
ncbi:hypothetical protein J6590_006936 [Homalodisca vitripennis]|nr:hypothetical protein J6590_006936 [Homalodisca vitripennis]